MILEVALQSVCNAVLYQCHIFERHTEDHLPLLSVAIAQNASLSMTGFKTVGINHPEPPEDWRPGN